MKHADFHVGLEFVGTAGFRWRCTDVGLRTILAIQLDRDDPNWYQGPPYIAKEVVFDELEIKRCHLTEAEALAAAVRVHKATAHPGYPVDAIQRMIESRHTQPYPNPRVLRFDRRRPDGEILHPYEGRKEGRNWMVELYLPFLESYDVMLEQDFIALPRASTKDIQTRAGRRTDS